MDNLLNVREASERLNCSKSTLYRIVGSGEISFIRRRRRLLFKESDLKTYVNSRRVPRLERRFLLTAPFKADSYSFGGVELMPKGKFKARRNYGYGNVHQRKTGGNWTRDLYVNGERIQKVIPDSFGLSKEEALHIHLQERVKSFDKPHEIEEPRQKKIGFRTFAEPYHRDYMQVNRRNFKPDVYRLQIVCDYFKDRDLRTFTPLDFEGLKAWLLRRGCSKSTVNRYLQLVKNFLNVAINEGYLEENPVRKVKLFSEKDNLKERILTEDEEKRLMQNCSDTLRPILSVALNTGMRRAEILNLTWNQIDFEARRIKVEKTKSGKVRHIPIEDDLFKQILKLKSENGQSPFVFFNPETKQPYQDMKTGFKRACRISEIEGLRFHDLRHTFATRLNANGVDIETIKELLGHHSIVITQRYTHSSDERKRKAIETLSKKSDKTTLNSDKDGDNSKSVELIS